MIAAASVAELARANARFLEDMADSISNALRRGELADDEDAARAAARRLRTAAQEALVAAGSLDLIGE